VPRAVIFGCEGHRLGAWERAFFARTQPLGFILFARNCDDPDQLRALIAGLRDSVGRPDAPVLIDQEGGRVQRLRPPHWRQVPAAARFGHLAERDLDKARQAVRLNARLLAAELAGLGITVNCAPVLDLRRPTTHDAIGDRAYGHDLAKVAALGRAFCDGLLDGGVLPVIKHLPGHGRAVVDSHHELPRVEATRAELEAGDFEVFRRLADAPLGITAHVLFTAIDPARPATTSPTVIAEIIRGSIGFDGLLLSDDLSMEALDGDLGDRTAAALAAGCDVALHCNGVRAEMEAAAQAAGPLSAEAERRLAAAAARQRPAQPLDLAALAEELDALLEAA
jgi:beta-N-acetylhexosaminidase